MNHNDWLEATGDQHKKDFERSMRVIDQRTDEMYAEAAKVNNPDNLKKQLIDAMAPRLGQLLAESVFQCDLWPVLQAAMKAGDLLVARNTEPQKPVADAIQGWLEGVITVVARVKQDEKTISRAQVLKILFDLDKVAQQALTDAKLLPF